MTLFFSLGVLAQINVNFVAHFCITLLGLMSGVKPRLTLLALVILYSANPKVRYDTVFSLGPFNNKSPFHYPFWGCCQG